jgi:glycosyltransferase involved in cell wall biosynthesis
MKIAMILDSEFPHDVRVENEALSLIKAGHEVNLFCLNFGTKKESEIVNGINVHRYKLPEWVFKKFSPLAFTIPVYLTILKYKIDRFLSRHVFEAIHVHDMVVAGIIFKLNKKYRLPVILDLHENRPEIMRTYSHVTNFPGNIFISIKRWKYLQDDFIKKSDYLIVVTEQAREEIIKNLEIKPEKIYVVPNTVNLEVFLSYPINKEIIDKYNNQYIILYVGATAFRRGIDTAIKAVALARYKIDNIKLVLVGQSRDDTHFNRMVKELSIEKYVDFEGWQDMSLFPSYIQASNCCISPLIKNRHHDTTFANKLFQYMCMEKPVIVSDCKAQATVIRESLCGLVHKPSDEYDLYKKIIYLYNHPQKAEQMGKNGGNIVRDKYNWVNTAQDILRLYENIKNERIRFN